MLSLRFAPSHCSSALGEKQETSGSAVAPSGQQCGLATVTPKDFPYGRHELGMLISLVWHGVYKRTCLGHALPRSALRRCSCRQ